MRSTSKHPANPPLNFSDWDQMATPVPCRKSKYRVYVELEPDRRYRFRYLADGWQWYNAPQADAYVPGGHGSENGVVSTAVCSGGACQAAAD